jgi:hypothetical protein
MLKPVLSTSKDAVSLKKNYIYILYKQHNSKERARDVYHVSNLGFCQTIPLNSILHIVHHSI